MEFPVIFEQIGFAVLNTSGIVRIEVQDRVKELTWSNGL